MPVIDDFEDEAIAAAYARDEENAHQIVKAWRSMEADLVKGGALAQVVLSFRKSAIKAMNDLVYVPADNPEAIRALQNQVRRFFETITLIEDYRTQAQLHDEANELNEREERVTRSLRGYDYAE